MNTRTIFETAITLYRGIIVAASASYILTLITLYGIFKDKMLSNYSGQMTITLLLGVSLSMWYWLYYQIKMYRIKVGDIFPPNPGVLSDLYSNWEEMRWNLLCGILLVVSSLIFCFYFPKSLLPTFLCILCIFGSLCYFFPAGKFARRVHFKNRRVE